MRDARRQLRPVHPRADASAPEKRRRETPRPGATGRFAAALVILLAVAGAFGLAACAGSDEDGGHESVLARVNGVEISRAEVDGVRAEARLAGKDDDAAAALDEAIGRELVRQEAARLGVQVDEAAIDERLVELTARFGGEEALAQALESAAMTREQLRSGTAHGLLREKLRDRRFGGLAVSESAAREFYREHIDDLFTEPAAVRLGSILVRTERQAEKLATDIREGAAFDRVARQYSRDPESKASGGMLGWITESTLPDSLRDAVKGLARGSVSDPVEGPGGWFLLKLYDRRAARVATFAEVEEELRAELDRRKQMRALDRWIAAERGRAEIEMLGS